MSSYRELFKPGKIGSMEIRNRIVMPPMVSAFGRMGYVTERSRSYYEERARGGAGLIIVESTCVDSPGGWPSERRLRIDGDEFIPGLRELTGVIHRHGARAGLQINHSGIYARSSFTGRQPVAPSPIPGPGDKVSHELTVDEIRELVGCFARAAGRAQQAGFDGVEIHAAATYLVAEFLMLASNQRRDGYGGDIKGRARFLLEIVEATRKVVGPGYPVWCRINGKEGGVLGDLSPDDLRELAPILERGGLDAIHVTDVPSARSYFAPPGYSVENAAAAKQAVSIPVIVAGGIAPELGESVLEQGKADFIAMGRLLIADPALPAKLAAGNLEDINPCIRCGECQYSIDVKDEPVCCSVNAAVGVEREYQLSPARKKKKVLVVGGGPAGLEAARVAALRGHQVMLYERDGALGGQMLLAAKLAHKELVASLIRYLTGQVRKLGVRVELGKAVNTALVAELKPDVVIAATGVVPFIPEIPGVGNGNVVVAEDVLRDGSKVGREVVVIGGGLVGCETALSLSTAGKKVTILEVMSELIPGTAVPVRVRTDLLGLLRAQGVAMFAGVTCEGITGAGVLICNGEGKRETIKADTVVLAAGGKPNAGLFATLKGKVPEIHLVGDCNRPGNILGAIRDSAWVARVI